MSWFLFLLLLHFPPCTCSSVVLPAVCNHEDSSNLLQFKNSFAVMNSYWLTPYCSSYSKSKTTSWKNGTDCCHWDGVTCDTMSGHVIDLNLSCAMLMLIVNATNLKELVLDEIDMSAIREGSLSLLMNLSTSLVSLNLQETGLHGQFPISILRLPNLQELRLSGNSELRGQLPKSNWSAPLTVMDLFYTAFLGEIPDSIGQLKYLNQIWLSDCCFDGLVPLSLWNLTQLTTLAFARNKLHGEISSLLSNLKHLISLDLQGNNFSGHIPDVFANFTKLDFLALSYNNLGGQLPPSLFQLTQLSHLDLSFNYLEGSIPSQTTKLSELIVLRLDNNLLNGKIPQWCYSLPLLKEFSLSNNQLIAKLPRFLERLQSLKALDLSNNQIDGGVPKWFNNLLYKWNMDFIDLSFNKLREDLPNLPDGISYFSASNNNFTGEISPTICNASIPGNFSKGNAFETIKLNGNQLEGPVPQSLAHCTKLEVLDLGDNNIEDVFPSWLETLEELQVLSLRDNKFHGTITGLSIKHPFPKLRIFDVSNNSFSGPLPMQYLKEFQGMMTVNDSAQEYMITNGRTYGSYNDSVVVIMKGELIEMSRILTLFTTIDLSNNMFEGEIPHVIGELSSLKGLNLSHNEISGNIPQTLGNLTSLEWLDLSWNQLKGEIPMILTNLNFLSVLNLSENQLQGLIPTGKQFNTFQNDSYIGNPMLCGFPLSKSCGNDDEEPPSVSDQGEESGFGWKAVAMGYGCGVVFGMILGRLFIKTAKPLWLARLLCGYT
ncbi:hypothetical protein PIB30_061547 [Stylosanthes scabra]|uniref:Leucine-rich repeat-containing N-terminal plant-type domain-containing protein n=1 Tax=Stylosanthes scabra TaxID=79078 RepID=A0ABU6RL84_9FABA|nr:hypothetical protein [Stylosanthes scabra]